MDYSQWRRIIEDAARQRKIATSQAFDPDTVAKDFLTFSHTQPEKTLSVHLPAPYTVEGAERNHFQAIRTTLGLPTNPLPTTIDFGGISTIKDPLTTLILLSREQQKADHLRRARSYINPLLEKVYTEGAALIQDFAINEGLTGTVELHRGTLKLEETTLFPDRFLPGPYTLSVTLETPTQTIAQYLHLHEQLEAG